MIHTLYHSAQQTKVKLKLIYILLPWWYIPMVIMMICYTVVRSYYDGNYIPQIYHTMLLSMFS